MPMSLKFTFPAQTCLLNFKLVYTTACCTNLLQCQMGISKLICPKLNFSFPLSLANLFHLESFFIFHLNGWPILSVAQKKYWLHSRLFPSLTSIFNLLEILLLYLKIYPESNLFSNFHCYHILTDFPASIYVQIILTQQPEGSL